MAFVTVCHYVPGARNARIERKHVPFYGICHCMSLYAWPGLPLGGATGGSDGFALVRRIRIGNQTEPNGNQTESNGIKRDQTECGINTGLIAFAMIPYGNS